MTKTNAMKKYLFILGLFLCFSVALDAQLKLDFEAGSNFSKSIFESYFEFINNDQVDLKFGYYVGLVPRLKINERWNFTTILQFSQEGFKLSDQDYQHRYRYIRLIPELELKIIERFFLNGGVNFGYMLDQNYFRDGESIRPDKIRWIEDVDYGLIIGAKYNFNRFLFSARYYLGIMDITDTTTLRHSHGSMNSNEVVQQNRNLQLGVGIRLIK